MLGYMDFGFGSLNAAQASADLAVLRKHGRRVIAVDLGGRPIEALSALAERARGVHRLRHETSDSSPRSTYRHRALA